MALRTRSWIWLISLKVLSKRKHLDQLSVAWSTSISDPSAYCFGIVRHEEAVRTLLKFWRKLILTGTLRVSLQDFPELQYFDTKLPVVVFITSNYIGNTEIMQGCKENNIPCFGTLWDFVRIVYFYTSWTILTDAIVKKSLLFANLQQQHIHIHIYGQELDKKDGSLWQ